MHIGGIGSSGGENLYMNLEKRMAEVEYRTAIPKPGEVKELLQLMKEFGVQRLNIGGLNIEMPYVPAMGAPVVPS